MNNKLRQNQEECNHRLVEIDNAGRYGFFKCLRCGAMIAGTSEQVAKYKRASNPAARNTRVSTFFGDRYFGVSIFLFLVVCAAVFLAVSHLQTARLWAMGVILLALIVQCFIACRRWRIAFYWLLAAVVPAKHSCPCLQPDKNRSLRRLRIH